MQEQRSYLRIPFHTEANLTIGGNLYPCELVDLALQCALFKTEQPLPLRIGEHCQITIRLPASKLTMDFTGELMHQRGQFIGFIFTSEDATTMGHLRRLLELNFGSDEEADREFQHWLKRI